MQISSTQTVQPLYKSQPNFSAESPAKPAIQPVQPGLERSSAYPRPLFSGFAFYSRIVTQEEEDRDNQYLDELLTDWAQEFNSHPITFLDSGEDSIAKTLKTHGFDQPFTKPRVEPGQLQLIQLGNPTQDIYLLNQPFGPKTPIFSLLRLKDKAKLSTRYQEETYQESSGYPVPTYFVSGRKQGNSPHPSQETLMNPRASVDEHSPDRFVSSRKKSLFDRAADIQKAIAR